jgi:hypothetical protein
MKLAIAWEPYDFHIQLHTLRTTYQLSAGQQECTLVAGKVMASVTAEEEDYVFM